MLRSITLPALLVGLATACAATRATPEAPSPTRREARSEPAPTSATAMERANSDLAPREGSTAVVDAVPAVASRERASPRDDGRRIELELWRDPEFRRRFAESYLAETDIEPRLTADERETMQKVLELLGADELEAAARVLEKSRNAASSAVLDFTLANVHFQREQFGEAAALYRTSVDKYPRFRRAWRNLGLIHVRRGEFAPALTALTRVIELGGGDAITYGLVGFSYSNVGNHLAAESAYRMAILLDPATGDWKLGLARSFFEQRRFADAVSLCGGMLESQPERADLWLLQANAYIGLEQPARAAENYEIVDRLGQSTADSLHMLGDIYVNEALFDLAVDCYARGMDKDPKAKPDRALRAAKVLTARGALKETRDLLERIESRHGATMDESTRMDLLKLRARIAVADGSGDEEAQVLERIVELDPLDGEALILLGQHAGRAGDAEKAVFYYERAAGLEAFEADAKVRHAQLLVGQGKYVEALPLLRRAQALEPRENIQQYLEQVERVAQGR